jgi:translation initiation factor 5
MAVNIRRDLSDPFYRYKMPLLQAKIEGSGNGIKTNITNLKDVAKALSRPNNYPFKYFGYELGAQVIADEKNNRFIITGAHDAKYLQDILDGFINKFVLCGSCKNPETDLIVVKKDILKQCKACGAATKADMVHSLASFIIKSQPDIGKKSKK